MEPFALDRSTQRSESGSMSYAHLVDPSHKEFKAEQGRQKFYLIQARKDLDKHILLMQNRINYLHSEEAQLTKTNASHEAKSKQLLDIRREYRDFKENLNTTKELTKQELTHKQLVIQQVREASKKRIEAAKKRTSLQKQEARQKVRAESEANRKIIQKINQVYSARKREKAQAVFSQRKQVQLSRELKAQNFVEELNHEFVTKLEQELVAAQNAKRKLQGLTDHEESLMDSLKFTGSLAKEVQETDLLQTQVLQFD